MNLLVAECPAVPAARSTFTRMFDSSLPATSLNWTAVSRSMSCAPSQRPRRTPSTPPKGDHSPAGLASGHVHHRISSSRYIVITATTCRQEKSEIGNVTSLSHVCTCYVQRSLRMHVPVSIASFKLYSFLYAYIYIYKGLVGFY